MPRKGDDETQTPEQLAGIEARLPVSGPDCLSIEPTRAIRYAQRAPGDPAFALVYPSPGRQTFAPLRSTCGTTRQGRKRCSAPTPTRDREFGLLLRAVHAGH